MAPKRSAPKAAAAKPAKKSKGKVPEVLTEASAVLPQSDFVKLIKQHVLPGIDDEAFKSTFQQAINSFKAKNAENQVCSSQR